MNESDHLTRNEIAAFADGSLPSDESRIIGGHLLRCFDCRSLLPLPDTKQLWTAIMKDRDAEQPPVASSDPSLERSLSQTFAEIFTKPGNLAWGTGVLLVIFGLAVLGMLRVSSENQTEVVQSFEVDQPDSMSKYNGLENPEDPVSAFSESRAARSRKSKATSTYKQKEQSSRDNQVTGRSPIGHTKANVSSVRGATALCEEGRNIEMQIGSYKSDFVLKWKSVARATKYHLYVSDENEILVDEFETASDTSYTLKEPLDPAKSYKWKIVITLDSGQTLYIDAQKFSAKDFQSNHGKLKSRANSNTRCVAN